MRPEDLREHLGARVVAHQAHRAHAEDPGRLHRDRSEHRPRLRPLRHQCRDPPQRPLGLG